MGFFGTRDGNDVMTKSGSPSVLDRLFESGSACEEEEVVEELADFTAVYREHAKFLFSVLRRLRVHESAVDDALQEVFVVAYRRRRSFQEGASLRSWLYGITIRVARSHNRKAALRRMVFYPLRAEDEAVESTSGYDSVENNEALAVVDSILEKMPRKQREVFVLMELEELSAQESASILRCNVNTIYSRLRLARERFEASATRHRASERAI